MKKLAAIIVLIALSISINAQSNCDLWVASDSTNAPIKRNGTSVVWTGSEMIIWGGVTISSSYVFTYYNTGNRYNPVTDTWTNTSTTNAPTARIRQSAVWTGSEMVIWGGEDAYTYRLNTGGKYNPITDTWVATSTLNAPADRSNQKEVWTGTEMIIWGGGYYNPSGASIYMNTGGRYNPITDTWTTTNGFNLQGRWHHTAIWTGTEMIVWGGSGNGANPFNDGARYNPVTNTCIYTNSVNAPTPRMNHSAVWTGTEMIIWGGSCVNTGGKYNPTTDTWTPTDSINAPTGRYDHTAIMTNCNEMIIWGGVTYMPTNNIFNTGSIYYPVTNTWAPMTTTNAPGAAAEHKAVWTGTEMIVWCGDNVGATKLAYRYTPINCCTNSVNSTSSITASPSTLCGTYSTTLGVSGGNLASGANWNWYTGSCGGTYIISGASPMVSLTTATTYWVRAEGTNYISTCLSTTVVVNTNTLGTALVLVSPILMTVGSSSTLDVFGGMLGQGANWYWYVGSCGNGNYIATGTSVTLSPTTTTNYYTRIEGPCNTTSCLNNVISISPPTCDTWVATSLTNAPAPRFQHTAVWTGSEMIVWGGCGGSNTNYYNSGGKYNPVTDTWTSTSLVNAPDPRYLHTAIWTGTEMIVWGGFITLNQITYTLYTNTGGRYNPITDTWTSTSTINAPAARTFHNAIWTGSEMIVWGGSGSSDYTSGGRYNPSTDTWVATSTINAPITRTNFSTVWTGTEMIVWGGAHYDLINNTTYTIDNGGRYNPTTDTWVATSITGAPIGRLQHTSVWTGTEMIVWGGGSYYGGTIYNSGGRYNPTTDTWVATSTVNAPFPVLGNIGVWSSCNEMLVFGSVFGGKYDPANDTWTQITLNNSPLKRYYHSSVWTGTEFIVWGGNANIYSTYFLTNTGGRSKVCCGSIMPYSAVANTPICAGTQSMLGTIAGNLGTGENWNWYTGSCGGTYIISGASPLVSPTTTTTYWVRAESATNTSACLSITVSVNTLSTIPISASASPAIITSGASSILTFTGGSLGTGANWYWYSGSCGGYCISSSTTITQSPSVNTTYYIRAVGTCNTTPCVSVTITVSTTYIYNVYNDENNISIYPNPATSSFIVISDENNVLVKLFNVSGQLIKEQSLNNNNVVDVKDIEKGIYLIEIIKKNNSIHKIIIIK